MKSNLKMDLINYKKYNLRDAIKIRKLLEHCLEKNKNVIIEECFSHLLIRDSFRDKAYHPREYILLLLFHFNYKGIIRIYQRSNGVIVIQQNKNSGKFFTNDDMRSKTSNNNYFLYLGTYKQDEQEESTKYDVVYDFVLQETGLVTDLDLENTYTEIIIPSRTYQVERPLGKTYSNELFEDMISGKIGDVKLLCTDGEIFCSKYLLAFHSEYFKNYFSFEQKIGNKTDKITLNFKVQDVKLYIYYCFFGKLNPQDIYPELVEMGKYFMHKEFVNYLYQEIVIKIDSDLEIQPLEKIELYENLLTYFLT